MPAVISLPAIDEVEGTANEYGIEYEDTASYRGAAGCLVFVASAAILYHVLAIIIRILYISSVVEKYFTLYVYTVSTNYSINSNNCYSITQCP